MGEFSGDIIEGTFDFFVLNAFKDGPLSGSAVEQRVERAQALLELAAERKGKRNPGSLITVLQRLERAGWLRIEPQNSERLDAKNTYVLTAAGKQQLEDEWMRRMATSGGMSPFS
jgi:PadR family transcriptional regulator PadR